MAVKLFPGRVAGGCSRWPCSPGRWLPDFGPGDVVVTDARGPGHGPLSSAATKVAEQAMRTEGLIVDSVYAKALALAQRPVGGQTVVFWHTGGVLDAVAAPGEAHK
jgi:hypothetical protein